MTLSGKTVERLSVYRRLLAMQGFSADDSVYSHQLAEMVSGTAAQVRRDLMEVGVTGHSKRGYRVAHLISEISRLLDDPQGSRVVLVGVGDLGRALLRFMKSHHDRLRVVGAFDNDPAKVGCVVHGYRCRAMDELERVIDEERVSVAIIATPTEGAQAVCDRLVAAGVQGLVNFAPSPLHVPSGVSLERVDIASALEKVACLGRWHAGQTVPAEVTEDGLNVNDGEQ